ncbi:MAG: amidohydrolase family protein [Eggerthellaceae bacterium]|jgi:5-methylthioadenosine/S-adenosylhomocysteine deaminase
MLLRAQYIIPVTDEPFENGAVLVRDGVIRDMGSAELLSLRYPDEESVDFGMSAIMPGMIDLFSRLENSAMRGIVPDQKYPGWVMSVHEAGAKLDAHDWHASSVLGGLEALSNGITCVADVSATGASCTAMQKLGLRGVVYREVGAMDKRRVDDAMDRAHNDIVRWQESVGSDLLTIGIAPRETYACHPAVYKQAAAIAREEDIPIAVAVAGSREEYDFIKYGSSAFSISSLASRRGFVEVPPWLPTGVSPVRYVLNWGAFEADNVTAVHCIHLDEDDTQMLKERGVSIVVCPRCNAQLSMGIAPLREFLRAGITVGLGSGYAVATDAADVLSEMRMGLLLNRGANPGKFLPAKTMLELGTIGAARALKIDDKVGSLEIGKRADIVAVDLSNSRQAPTDDPVTALVDTCLGDDVLMTMVDGNVRYEKDKWNVDLEVARDIARVIEIRGKLRKH